MAEYIDREALYEKAYWHGGHPDVGNPFPDGVDAIDIKDVDAIPPADVAPVRKGRWESDGLSSLKCSDCGYLDDMKMCHRYCPDCGCFMR